MIKEGYYLDGNYCNLNLSGYLTELKKSGEIKWMLECYRRFLIKVRLIMYFVEITLENYSF